MPEIRQMIKIHTRHKISSNQSRILDFCEIPRTPLLLSRCCRDVEER